MSQIELTLTVFKELTVILFAIMSGGWVLYLIISWLLGYTKECDQISDILERQSEHDQWKHTTIEPTTTTANKKFIYDHTNTNDPIYRITKLEEDE